MEYTDRDLVCPPAIGKGIDQVTSGGFVYGEKKCLLLDDMNNLYLKLLGNLYPSKRTQA